MVKSATGVRLIDFLDASSISEFFDDFVLNGCDLGRQTNAGVLASPGEFSMITKSISRLVA